mmetsp:Transcript_10534/g.19663  ORF Transcript_10534/g.19663 Transcript_10534/m.19663 type:complete len:416 (+) Transcript_10534:119-1366(+)|eukprot:CAMPEP_0176501496 /NCGR_PEP_ID=MMETSP0200_2-20121128/14189_1 /TAXON_ID=947934 /ORGANISM="Chaetoceros sp., Strain GSL56" /LENGTH=415 /DNA_ID=CAMNT_0017900381 /DNA_START=109 /DNA_END=1356 /DNA_ORIENTATION=-
MLLQEAQDGGRSATPTHYVNSSTAATVAVAVAVGGGGYDHHEHTNTGNSHSMNQVTWKNRSGGGGSGGGGGGGSSGSNRSTSNLHGKGGGGGGKGPIMSHPSNPFLNNGNGHFMDMSPTVYLQRIMDISQMDIQSAMDQMKSLLVPYKINSVFKMAYYRKQTKNHWARDDPAFVFLQIVLLATASLAYAIAFRSDSLVANFLYFSFHSIFINYFLLGLALSSLARYLANQYLNQTNVMSGSGSASGGNSSAVSIGIGSGDGDHQGGNIANSSSSSGTNNITNHNSTTTMMSSRRRTPYHVRQSVEFMYAFDVHCNAFFVLFVFIYGLQFFLLPIVLGKGFFSFLVSNVLYSVAFFGYFYVTHLGYRALPFLYNTEVFLFPLAVVVFVFVLNLIGYPLGFGWNASRIMAHLYFERV